VSLFILDNPELARARIKRDLRRQAEPLRFALAPVGGKVSSNGKNLPIEH
jgi:hypothetical protein